MPKLQLLLPSALVLLLVNSQPCHSNTLFHFGFHFQVRDDSSSAEATHIDHSISVHNDGIAITDNLAEASSTPTSPLSTITAAPVGGDWDAIWVEQQQLNATAADKIQLTRSAIFKLNQELIEVVGRSDVLAAKAKLTTRYINSVDALLAKGGADGGSSTAASKFTLLRQFVELVDQLREVSVQRSVDFLALKLLLEKYKILELQSDVHQQVVEAEKAWQRYVKAKLVQVSV